MLPLILMLLDVQARAPEGAATCGVERSATISRSSSGIPQVGNLALISMVATIPARPSPVAGQSQDGLQVEVSVYERASDGTRKVVPATVNLSGGGLERGRDAAYFTLDIPIDPAERDAAIREYFSEVIRQASSSPNEDTRKAALGLQEAAGNPQLFAPMFRQHRAGRFDVECRVLDQRRLVGVGHTTLEVVFKGRFFDQDAFRKK